MKYPSAYQCPEKQCNRAPLVPSANGLCCPNGHFFPFAAGTDVPIFAKQSEGANEYAQRDAAVIHDNALRWVFSTFKTTEPELRERLIARLALVPGSKVLVTGAGAGNDIPYLINSLGSAGDIYVQDIAEEMLLAGVERHQKGARESGIGLHFSVSDAMNLPFADNDFDAAYHFGGINLFPDIRQGIAEMDRVVKPGGTVVIGDEGLAPWLVDTEIGRMLIRNNPLYACQPPLALLPEFARSVKLSWELSNTFYALEFLASDTPLPIDIDVKHVGRRGGSIRTRYFGQIEGIDPDLKERIYAEAERKGISRVDYIELLLRQGLTEG